MQKSPFAEGGHRKVFMATLEQDQSAVGKINDCVTKCFIYGHVLQAC